MANTARSEFSQEKAAAAYQYLGLKREQLLDRLVTLSSELSERTPNQNLGVPSAIAPKAYLHFTDYVDYLIFHFVRAEAKSHGLSMLRETRKHGPISGLALIQFGLIDPIYVMSRSSLGNKDIFSLTGEDISNLGRYSAKPTALHWRVSILTARTVIEMTNNFACLPENVPAIFLPTQPAVVAKKPEKISTAQAAEEIIGITDKEKNILQAYREDRFFRQRVNAALKIVGPEKF